MRVLPFRKVSRKAEPGTGVGSNFRFVSDLELKPTKNETQKRTPAANAVAPRGAERHTHTPRESTKTPTGARSYHRDTYASFGMSPPQRSINFERGTWTSECLAAATLSGDGSPCAWMGG